jgi:signal transduction histidine kinase/ActR/RegA family two-component response regulator
MFGFASVDEALRTDTNTIYSNTDLRERFLHALREQKRLEYQETEYRRKDGARLYCIENDVGIFDDKGKLVQIRGYLFDDTKRKILETQLLQAQKLESLGTLAGGIAHDFNNILGIIIGYASLLTREEPDPESVKNSAEAVVKASMRGAALVKQLLTFARKADTQLTLVKLNDIVSEISKLLSETIAKTIEITLDLDKGLPAISADATQIHQVMLNLCVNARDAMPNGGTLTIVTQLQQSDAIRNKFPKAAAPQYIVLSVTDTGVGMDEKTRSRIFEPFFTTKEIGKGTGLGLSVVFGILESHKGFVNVESEPGKGTTFYLYFPVPESMENKQAEAEIQKEIPRGTETILVVEDEEMLRELLKNILQSAGYTVLTAVDGQEAIDLFDQHRDDIQLVLSDLGLPRLSGYDVFRKMKLMKSDVRFILVSGFMESQTKTEMSKEGIKDFIQKPFSFNTVMLSIRTVLDQK